MLLFQLVCQYNYEYMYSHCSMLRLQTSDTKIENFICLLNASNGKAIFKSILRIEYILTVMLKQSTDKEN